MAEQSTVQSLDRAFDLLETLCRSRNGMSIGGLSAETGLHKSTVHRLLTSMCARGYVQRDAETSVYRAGMRLCELSSYIVDNLDIVERARASLERLEQCTDETVHLVMRDDKDIVYIHKVDNGSSAIRMFSRIGMRLPLYCTGVGKAILATWDTAEVRDVWQHSDVHAWTEHTIVDEDAFFREIDKVRQLVDLTEKRVSLVTRSTMRRTSLACAALRPPFRTTADARPTRFRCLRRSAA